MEEKELLIHAKNLRKNMTQEERKLWYLFLKAYPVHFRRQSPQRGYILDFYCHSVKLAVELDGSQHYDSKNLAYDKRHTQVLCEAGIHVVRFSNYEVNRQFRSVCEAIDLAVKERWGCPPQSAALTAPPEGEPRA